jgi:hypothetical protein
LKIAATSSPRFNPLKDHADLIWADEDWRVDVADDSRLIFYVMHIGATDTAATMSPRMPGRL